VKDVDLEANAILALQQERGYHWRGPTSAICPPVKAPKDPSTGTGAISNAAHVVASMRPGFRACFQDFLGRLPAAPPGKVRLSMHVDCAGKVSEVHARVSGIDEQAVACMFRTAVERTFDAPEGGASIVNVPVTFVRTK